MTVYAHALMTSQAMFGSGEVEFTRWETPFENAKVWAHHVSYDEGTLVIRVAVWSSESGVSLNPEPVYLVTFTEVSAFRVLDECGLLQFWEQSPETSKRGLTTFRVRNHGWAKESYLSFFHGTNDGWSFVIATDDDCVEILAQNPPAITNA